MCEFPKWFLDASLSPAHSGRTCTFFMWAKPYKNKERNTCDGIPPHYLLIAQKMGANYSVCSINMELSFKLTVIE